MGHINYLKFYDDEKYLFDEVGPRFRVTGKISPADFYMILIWKAERKKTDHRNRLKKKSGTFRTAVSGIASDLRRAHGRKMRLQILMKKWGFRLPTATAILAILYPKTFTVYDWRVRKEVKRADWSARVFSDKLWNEYQQFTAAVKAATPLSLSLRDKDRFLIGRSTRRDIQRDWRL